MNPTAHPAFDLIRTVAVTTLGLEVSEYRHRKTGALHYHLASDNDENVFLVALRTVPHDSTGVAHILEHTALCGSERYPVRDPFFMMVRRSLNTFMNAFTSSDWTAYPFASKNAKDFENLLQVYLDAVFFSRLDPLDFAQEGHRLEFAEPDNADSELVYRGVVYNEMKGAMSSPVSTLYQTLTRYLFPTTTYHHNSGGDPACIPDLGYDQLLAFYRTHYHPSNAVFMTYGNRPAHDLQERIETLALNRFDALDTRVQVPPEKRYCAPVRVEEGYAWQLQDGETRDTIDTTRTHVVLGWLLGDAADLRSNLEAHLLSDVLLENSASPLRHMLETCGLGDAPSPLCGLEDSNREMSFMCGLEGTSLEHAATIEARIMEVLEGVARDGIPAERLEALLHQLELHQREIGGDGYPFGLQLILAGLPAAIHHGDPIAVLDIDAVLVWLREAIQSPTYIPDLVKRLLINNPHRVRLTLRPDTELESIRDGLVRDHLAKVKAGLDESARQHLIEQAAALKQRQLQTPDAERLPKVGLEDVPAHQPMAAEATDVPARLPIAGYAQGTNGLVYHQIFYALPALDENEVRSLPLLAGVLTEVGAGQRDYLAQQDHITAVSGGISAFSLLRSDITDTQNVKGYFGLSGKALMRHQTALAELLHETATRARFDEHDRIRELVSQARSRMEQSVTHNGHGLAMTAACAGMNPTARTAHHSGGLAGIQRLQALDDSLEQGDGLGQWCERLATLANRLRGVAPRFLVVGEYDALAAGKASIDVLWGSQTIAPPSSLALPTVSEQVREVWLANTQVSFCAKAYPSVAVDHPDAAVLAVLGGFLHNGFLHRAIREQGGAYGSGASQDSNVGAFRFYSYRDPRIGGTLDDFDAALEWLQAEAHGYQALEEAILGVIGGLDKPGSPAGEAKQAFQNRLFGRDDAFQARYRERVLRTGIDDLKRVASTWLKPERASLAVVTSRPAWDAAPVAGDITVHTL